MRGGGSSYGRTVIINLASYSADSVDTVASASYMLKWYASYLVSIVRTERRYRKL